MFTQQEELTALHCGTSLNELVNVKDLFQRTIEIVVDHQNTIGTSKMNYNQYVNRGDSILLPTLCIVYSLAEVLHLALNTVSILRPSPKSI